MIHNVEDKQSALNEELLNQNPKQEYLLSTLKVLLAKGAQVNSQNENGQSPLHLYLTRDVPTPVIELLLSKGADVTIKDNSGQTPLHHAVSNVAATHAKLLLDNKADPNSQDNEGRTPLHIAASYKLSSLGEKNPCIGVLLSYNANLNLQDKQGNTPLHLAARTGNRHTAAYLVEHGGKGSLRIKNKRNRLPVQEGIYDYLESQTYNS